MYIDDNIVQVEIEATMEDMEDDVYNSNGDGLLTHVNSIH
jgi:hypothetical protein